MNLLTDIDWQWKVFNLASEALDRFEGQVIQAAIRGDSLEISPSSFEFSSITDLRDYFRGARDLLESWASLGLFLSCEGEFRNDIEARMERRFQQLHPIHEALMALAPNRPDHSVKLKRIFDVWETNVPGEHALFSRLATARDFRNWFAHGGRGVMPTPYPLLASLLHSDASESKRLISQIQGEP